MSERMPLRTGRVSHYADVASRIAGVHINRPGWLSERQEVALRSFEERGFPLPSDEEWRFTPIGPIAETLFEPALGPSDAKDHSAAEHLGGLRAARVVFANGWPTESRAPAIELRDGVRIGTLREHINASADRTAEYLGQVAAGPPSLTDLNLALMQDGLFLHVPSGVSVDTPVHALYISSAGRVPLVVSPRSLIVLGRGSSAVLIESFVSCGGSDYWTNAVSEIVLEDGATLEHYRLQHEDGMAYHTGRTAVRLGRDAVYTSFSIQTGAVIARHDLDVVLSGEGGSCTLNGLYIGRDRQLLDNHTRIEHAVPHCESYEVYKGILSGRAHGVFNGKVLVRQDAQKTDAKQSNHVLLLSDAAHIDTKPQLEIFADDVRCTHGATVGQLDANALFYLRSRGIGFDDARSILIHAFASDIVERMPLPEVRAALEQLLTMSLPRSSSHSAG